MESYLASCKVLIKHFKSFAQGITQRVKAAAYGAAAKAGRPVKYLRSGQSNKEQIARQLAREDKIGQGLIAVFTALEPCLSYSVRGDAKTQEIHLAWETRKCLHLYHYYLHPNLGLMHARVQTWFPFRVDVCLNGPEWLARQMDRAGLKYIQRDNCFTWVQELEKAQRLLDEQSRTDWAKILNGILDLAHPLHEEIGRPFHQP